MDFLGLVFFNRSTQLTVLFQVGSCWLHFESTSFRGTWWQNHMRSRCLRQLAPSSAELEKRCDMDSLHMLDLGPSGVKKRWKTKGNLEHSLLTVKLQTSDMAGPSFAGALPNWSGFASRYIDTKRHEISEMRLRNERSRHKALCLRV